MINWILDIIGEDKVWAYLFDKIRFDDAEITDDIWVDAFRRIPLLRTWFKKREIQLLRSQLTGERPAATIRGEIMEIKYIQRYDVKSDDKATVKVEELKRQLPDKKEFLKNWETNAA